LGDQVVIDRQDELLLFSVGGPEKLAVPLAWHDLLEDAGR